MANGSQEGEQPNKFKAADGLKSGCPGFSLWLWYANFSSLLQFLLFFPWHWAWQLIACEIYIRYPRPLEKGWSQVLSMIPGKRKSCERDLLAPLGSSTCSWASHLGPVSDGDIVHLHWPYRGWKECITCKGEIDGQFWVTTPLFLYLHLEKSMKRSAVYSIMDLA